MRPMDITNEEFSPGSEGLLGQRSFRAMNTDVLLLARDVAWIPLLVRAEEVFHDVEARFSRFLPDSELSLLNAASGSRTTVSREMLDLLSRAIELNAITGGVFDPAVLPQLEAAGYDRSFEQVPRELAGDAAGMAPARHTISEAKLDPQKRTVTTPAGLRIDLGGIGKGYSVDLAAAVLAPARDFLVDAGGDIFASGRAPDADGWIVGVADPQQPERDVAVLCLSDVALATSTTAVRRWRRGGKWQNHLIDPRTGSPAQTGVVSVSVIANSTVEAEVFAKTALILGFEEGSRFLNARRAPGLFLMEDGQSCPTHDWPGDA